MIDIRLLKDEETRKAVRESQEKRYKDPETVDKLWEVYYKQQKMLFENEQIRKKINVNQTELKNAIKLNEKLKGGKSKKEIAMEILKPELKKSLEKGEEEITVLENTILELLGKIGNIISKDVPVSKDEKDNLVVWMRGEERCLYKPLGFSELMSRFTNPVAGSKIVGHRGYYLQGKLALLGNALKQYAIEFLTRNKGFEYIQPPVMIRKDVMSKTAQLSEFDDQLYAVGDDHYLVATSEQPLTALFMNTHLDPHSLPLLYAGDSLCFRREAGAYGKDNAGIFRVHQFDKIEMFTICRGEDSDDILKNTMLESAKQFYDSLEIPFRVVSIVYGELNDAAAIKFDLKAWFPNAKKFRELVSCSNCTDYQSRRLKVYCGYEKKDGNKPAFVHMLNATLCAVQRTLCCIVENYQDEDGNIHVPKVLQKYLDFDIIKK